MKLITSRIGKISVWVIVLAALLIGLTFTYAVEFSGFAFGLFKLGIAIGLFWAFDKYGLPTIDTIEELKKGNIAYALFLVALAIMFAAILYGA